MEILFDFTRLRSSVDRSSSVKIKIIIMLLFFKLFFNIMGSIGAEKTLLLENIAERLSSKYRIFVIKGENFLDGEKLLECEMKIVVQ